MRIVAHTREREVFLLNLPLEGHGSARLTASFTPGSKAVIADEYGKLVEGDGGTLLLDVENKSPYKKVFPCWLSLEGTPEVKVPEKKPAPEAPPPSEGEDDDDVSQWTKAKCKAWLEDHDFEAPDLKVADLRDLVLDGMAQIEAQEGAGEASKAPEAPEAAHPAPTPEKAAGVAFLLSLDAAITLPGRGTEVYRGFIYGSTVDPASGHQQVTLRLRSRKTGRDLK